MYENYRVLFVDDEQNILNSLRRGLADEEYFCHFAGSGKEALEIIKNETIAVIVTDMRMPEMNGLELLTEVTKLSPMTVMGVLSGYTQLPQILVTVNQVDIFKFITKPWELKELIMVIRKCLDYYIVREQNANYKMTLEAKNISYQNILKKINEMIDDAKLSKAILGICGKIMIGFERDFSPDERIAFQKILNCREQLFDILTDKVTILTKEMETTELAAHISDHVKNLFPEVVMEHETGNSERINVNLKMLEAAVDVLWAVFSDDFLRCGLFCRIMIGGPFTLTILSPNIESKKPGGMAGRRTETDVKMELTRALMENMLKLCGMKFKILTLKGSMAAEIALIDQGGRGFHEKNIDR